LFTIEEGSALRAEGLRWTHWGQPVATVSGYLFRSFAGSQASEPGSVTLSKPVTCNGKLYYAAATFKPPGVLLTPASPIPVKTPC
jgi:hypothetical protein